MQPACRVAGRKEHRPAGSFILRDVSLEKPMRRLIFLALVFLALTVLSAGLAACSSARAPTAAPAPSSTYLD
jgi:hypothetical protein